MFQVEWVQSALDRLATIWTDASSASCGAITSREGGSNTFCLRFLQLRQDELTLWCGHPTAEILHGTTGPGDGCRQDGAGNPRISQFFVRYDRSPVLAKHQSPVRGDRWQPGAGRADLEGHAPLSRQDPARPARPERGLPPDRSGRGRAGAGLREDPARLPPVPRRPAVPPDGRGPVPAVVHRPGVRGRVAAGRAVGRSRSHRRAARSPS